MPWKAQLSSLLTTFPCCRALMGEGQLLTLWTTSQGCIPEQMGIGICVPGHTAPWGGQRTAVQCPAHWDQPSAPCFVEHKHRQTCARCHRTPKKRDRRQGLYGWITSTGHIWLGTPTTAQLSLSAEKCLLFLPPRLVFQSTWNVALL